MKKTKILKIDFDRAVAIGRWSSKTCLLVQAALPIEIETEIMEVVRS